MLATDWGVKMCCQGVLVCPCQQHCSTQAASSWAGTQHYRVLTQGRGSHRDSWFWHSLELSLNHPNLCTEVVQFYLAELSPDRAANGQRPSQNWEGCSALALVYIPHLWKHHCCTSPRDSNVGQNRRQTFCRAVIIQARKTQELPHQKDEQRKSFPSISLSFAHCCQGSSSHCDPPPKSFRDFYKRITDSLELGVDILQVPLEGFTVQFVSQLHPVCNTGNNRQFAENKAVNRREGNNEDWPGGLRELCDFCHYSFSHVIVAGFRALAVTWGDEEERDKWQEIEMEDKHLQRAALALPLAQSDGRAQIPLC